MHTLCVPRLTRAQASQSHTAFGGARACRHPDQPDGVTRRKQMKRGLLDLDRQWRSACQDSRRARGAAEPRASRTRRAMRTRAEGVWADLTLLPTHLSYRAACTPAAATAWQQTSHHTIGEQCDSPALIDLPVPQTRVQDGPHKAGTNRGTHGVTFARPINSRQCSNTICHKRSNNVRYARPLALLRASVRRP